MSEVAVAQVAAAWEALGPTTGFLPRRAPATRLPDGSPPWLEAAAELPDRYHGAGRSVRAWLDATFADWGPAQAAIVDAFDGPERDRALTAISVLGHAYRWDCAPPTRAAYELKAIRLPPAIEAPWGQLARALDQPRVGNFYSMILCNWASDAIQPGAPYAAAALRAGARPAVRWLAGEDRHGLDAFLLTALETEARGTAAVATAVDALRAASRRDVSHAIFLLERLRHELTDLSEPFKQRIQKANLRPEAFLTLVQPTTLWRLDEGEGPLEGASGPQMGAMQVVDALLGVAARSPMAQATRRSRRYLPGIHRRFLDAFDAAAPIFARFVAESDDARLIGELNGCVTLIRSWRLVHKARGAMYLRGGPGAPPAGYASTGGVVDLDADRVRVFEETMEARVHEVLAAGLPARESDTSIEAYHRYLHPADRAEIARRATRVAYAPGERLIARGARRAGLWLVAAGAVEVRLGDVAIAALGPGQVLGEMSFVEVAAASADVVAVVPTEALHVSPEQVFAIVESDPEFGARFFQFLAALLARRLRQMNARVEADPDGP